EIADPLVNLVDASASADEINAVSLHDALPIWLKLVKDFLKVRCRLALLPFLISCLIWLDLVASLPLIKERILVIILLLNRSSDQIGRAVQQECRDRSRMPSSA